jgi:hypothetical protein
MRALARATVSALLRARTSVSAINLPKDGRAKLNRMARITTAVSSSIRVSPYCGLAVDMACVLG